MTDDHEIELKVVNNSVYQNYLEHARHEFLLSRGLDFAELTARKIQLVVTRAELDYRLSLTSGDRFVVGSRMRRASRLRFEFRQDIFRLPERRLVLSGRIVGTSLDAGGRPFLPTELEPLLGD